MTTLPARMKAVVAGSANGKPCPVISEIDVPSHGPEDILIKVAATGLNRGDLMQVAGLYPPPPGAPATLTIAGGTTPAGPVDGCGRMGRVGSEMSGCVAP